MLYNQPLPREIYPELGGTIAPVRKLLGNKVKSVDDFDSQLGAGATHALRNSDDR